jgi:hypothetical protein
MLLVAVKCQSKVSHLEDALIKQYVLWLDVPAPDTIPQCVYIVCDPLLLTDVV